MSEQIEASGELLVIEEGDEQIGSRDDPRWWRSVRVWTTVLVSGACLAGSFYGGVLFEKHTDSPNDAVAQALAAAVASYAGSGSDIGFSFSSKANVGTISTDGKTHFCVACGAGSFIIDKVTVQCDDMVHDVVITYSPGQLAHLTAPAAPWAIITRSQPAVNATH